jgi:hypothetical protein
MLEAKKQSRRIKNIPPPVPLSDSIIPNGDDVAPGAPCLKLERTDREQAGIRSGHDDTEPEAQFKYHCDIHGPHNGHHLGLAFTPRCSQCVSANRIKGITASHQRRIYIDTTKHAFVRKWLTDEAMKIGAGPEDVLLMLVLEKIPSNFIKEFFLNR